MTDNPSPYETFDVKLCRIDNENSVVEISVYDDGHDLQAFFSGSDSQGIRRAVESFHQVETLGKPFTENFPNKFGSYNFGLINNPTRPEIIAAIEAAICDLEIDGFQVTSKVNNWM